MVGYGKRVLVVDDDHHARFLLGALLDHAGYTVVPACDGRAALNELHKRHFDAVVTDYHMPFLNGLELVRLIHTHYPLIPVILVSGSLPVHDERLRTNGRPLWCLKKPYDKDSLLEVVQSAVNQSRVARHAEVECQPIADMG